MRDIPEGLRQYLLSMEKQEMLEVLLVAVDLMQGYNGQSVAEAVMEAVGARAEYDANGATVRTLPEKYSYQGGVDMSSEKGVAENAVWVGTDELARAWKERFQREREAAIGRKTEEGEGET